MREGYNLEVKYHEVVLDPESRKTYVVFSSVDIKPGNFMFWRVMQQVPGNKIFLNDIDNGWYVHGIPNLGKSVSETASSILKLIKQTNPSEVVFLGPSMGAFGAMLYGSILKPRLDEISVSCLSFGGEFVLYGRETRSGSLTKKKKNLIYSDIRSLIDSSGLNVIHVFGDEDINDIHQSILVSGINNISLIPVKGSPHAVSTFIGKNFNIVDFINKFPNTGFLDDIPLSGVSEKPSFGYNLFKGHIALTDGNDKQALEYLKIASREHPQHALARHKYGISLLQAGLVDESLKEQLAAIKLDEKLSNAYFHIGMIYEKKVEFKKSLESYLKCVEMSPKHIRARFGAAIMYKKLNQFDLATKQANEILKIDNGNKKTLALLKELIGN